MMKSTGSIASASRFTLAFALLLQMASASAQFSLIFNINDLKSREIETAYTTGQDTKEIVWTTSAKPMPEVQKNNDACARLPEYGHGAICYRVCGGSLASEPVRWIYEWRPAHLGHDTPWEACLENQGCKSFREEYYPDNGRGCGHFMIWKPQRPGKHDRDLRIRVQLR